MHLHDFPAGTTNWSQIPHSTHPGESGAASIRSRQLGDIQLRLVDYSPNYVSDHWCHKGHIVFVVTGRVTIEHQHGPTHALTTGMTYHVPDNEPSPHRLLSQTGATLFIVD